MLWQALLDLLFAPHCCACDARDARGLCLVCAESLYPIDSACPRCALPIDGPVSVVCGRCREQPPPFGATFAPYRYGGELGHALRRLKYQRRPDMARDLAPLFAPTLRHAVRMTGAQVAVPVPLHWRRLSARGFNQAATLLHFGRRAWAASAGQYQDPDEDQDHAASMPPIPPPISIDQLSLRRVRATVPQSGLSARQRRGNVASAFAVVPGRASRLRGKRVLLFDDIMTTGATMSACARVLLRAGAASVTGFCVARAEN